MDDDYLVSNHGRTETFYVKYEDEYGRSDQEGYITLYYYSAFRAQCEYASIDDLTLEH